MDDTLRSDCTQNKRRLVAHAIRTNHLHEMWVHVLRCGELRRYGKRRGKVCLPRMRGSGNVQAAQRLRTGLLLHGVRALYVRGEAGSVQISRLWKYGFRAHVTCGALSKKRGAFLGNAPRKSFIYFLSLCGLCIGQALFEHLSGIVLVPSIMSDPHISHTRPVGFALMAFLHSG